MICEGSRDDVDTFKLILYLCARHVYALKYLLKDNELQIQSVGVFW